MLCPPVKKIQVYQTFLFSFYSCQNWSSGMRFPKIPTLPLSYLKYSGDLNTKLVWYSNGQKEVECQMVWFWKAIWILDNAIIWIPDKWMPYSFLMYWFGIQMVGLVHSLDGPFKYWTIWSTNSKRLVFKCFRHSNGQYSDPQCFTRVLGYFPSWYSVWIKLIPAFISALFYCKGT